MLLRRSWLLGGPGFPAAQIARQAEMGAMLDVFGVTTWTFLAMLPLVFLLKRSKGPPPPAAAAME
jgi:hypothetical protein